MGGYKKPRGHSKTHIIRGPINQINYENAPKSPLIQNKNKIIITNKELMNITKIDKDIFINEEKFRNYKKDINGKIIDINNIEPEKAYPLLLKKQTFDYIALPEFKHNYYDNYSYTFPSYNTKNNQEKEKNSEVASQETS